MGFLDRLKEMAGKHGGKGEHGAERSAGTTEERTTGGTHREGADIDSVRDTLREREEGDRPPSG